MNEQETNFMVRRVVSLNTLPSSKPEDTKVVGYFGVPFLVPKLATGLATDEQGNLFAFFDSKVNQGSFSSLSLAKEKETELVQVAVIEYHGNWVDSVDRFCADFKVIQIIALNPFNDGNEKGTKTVEYFGASFVVPKDTVCLATDADGDMYVFNNAKVSSGNFSFFMDGSADTQHLTHIASVMYEGDWSQSLYFCEGRLDSEKEMQERIIQSSGKPEQRHKVFSAEEARSYTKEALSVEGRLKKVWRVIECAAWNQRYDVKLKHGTYVQIFKKIRSMLEPHGYLVEMREAKAVSGRKSTPFIYISWFSGDEA